MKLEQSLREHYVATFPSEAARVIERSTEVSDQLSDFSEESLTQLFEHVDPAHQRSLFLSLNAQRQEHVIESVSIRSSLQILGSLPTEDANSLLERLSAPTRKELGTLLNFPEGTAGRFMDRLATQYRIGQSVGGALSVLRKSKAQRVRSLQLVNGEGVLAGRVDLQDMALAEPDTAMADLMHPVGAVAYLTSSEQDLVELCDRFRVDSIPVVDQEFKLIGIVRHANLFRAAEEAATVDIQTMVGASADERALSPALFAVKRRLPWLHINLLTAFLAAAVVGLFESTIAQFTSLAILLPVVAGQSGNAGSQALAVTMRGLFLKEVTTLHWRPVLAKEMKIGLINGLALAVTCGLGVYVWSQSFGLALVIGIAMVCAMIMAGIAGALVPMVLLRVGQDPATASSIILTTVTDVAGFTVFLGTATLLSSML
jgi:magnesium transporter